MHAAMAGPGARPQLRAQPIAPAATRSTVGAPSARRTAFVKAARTAGVLVTGR
ncbi:hypothetical protein [Mesorhizobium sp.]|uniref:hypothetical protein n=1 Tax=Mesorhizobium sp. TaxID=1871066 RepID=UPI00257F292B|nr:hypothetical protein [Mesorhizobium sp.]